jgi:ribosomal protein S18 acetylase RimI-like enzyme
MDRSVSFRPIRPDDEAFLASVYVSTRTEELSVVPWSDAEKSAFLQMQFAAQHRYYQEHYAGAEFQVILIDGVPAGRLYVAHWPDETRIVDITLLPAYRNARIGSGILSDLLADAGRTGKPVTIHVEQFNPALRLYRRLGFHEVGEVGVYWLMKYSPPPSGHSVSDGP